MIAGFSQDEILHELLIAPRDALTRLPDSRIIAGPGWWQIVTPSLKRGGLNEVISTEFPLADANADATIDEILQRYRQLGLRFRWTISPGPGAMALGERLSRRGLRRSEAFAMARATQDAPSFAQVGFTIEVVDSANLNDFTRLLAEGWQMDAETLDPLHRRMLADPAGRHQFFVVRKDGVAAAVASSVYLERSVFLVGAVTLKPFREHGIYRALVETRLRRAAILGKRLAITLALAGTSAPILRRLGFAEVLPIPIFLPE
jgi:hypothetical protein